MFDVFAAAFTAFLEGLAARTPAEHQPVTLAYGARTNSLLIYRDVVEGCAERLPSLDVSYFVEHDVPAFFVDHDGPALEGRVRATPGRVSVEAVWPRLGRPFETSYYISGPPPMLRTIGQDLRAHNIAPEAIHIDAWE